MFVGNLSFDATEDEVKKLFSPCGVVKSVRIRHNRGCALVEMSDSSEAQNAINELDSKIYHGRKLRITYELSSKKDRLMVLRRYAGRSRNGWRTRECGRIADGEDNDPNGKKMPDNDDQ